MAPTRRIARTARPEFLGVFPADCSRASLAVICALLLMIPGVGQCASDDKDPTAQLSKLQSVTFAFADKYMSVIALVTTQITQRNPADPQLRLRMHTLKLLVGASVQGLAVSPNPESTLLDMMVYAALHRMVFEGKAGLAYYGDEADAVARVMRVLEKEIWNIANAYLTAEQVAEVDQLIRDWWAANPDLIVVSYIRFNDFASLRSESPLVEQASHSGFLVDISGAEQAVDEALLLAERALHYSQRLPWIMEWQVEKVFYQMAVEPEFRMSLEQTQSITQSLNRFANSLDELPRHVTAERKASINQMAHAIAAEREAFFTNLDARQEMLQGAVGGVRASLADADKLTIDLQTTTSTINEALVNADKLMARFDSGSGPDSAPSSPFDINLYVNAVD